MKVTYSYLEETLTDFNGCQFIGLDTKTVVKLKGGKKNPLQGRVIKITEGNNVMVFKSSVGYINMVNRRLRKEAKAEFEPQPRRWGTRIKDTPIIEHNGKKYLECIFISPGKTTYYLDGESIPKEIIEQDLPTTTNGHQGGLDDKVIVRTFGFDSIIKVTKSKEVLEFC